MPAGLAADDNSMLSVKSDAVKPVIKASEKSKQPAVPEIPSGSIVGESKTLSSPARMKREDSAPSSSRRAGQEKAEPSLSGRELEAKQNGIKVLGEVEGMIKQIQSLDDEHLRLSAEKGELESRFSEVLKRLNGEKQGLALKEKIPRYKQVMMTLQLISKELQKSLDSNDGTLESVIKRYRNYQTDEPTAAALKEAGQLVQSDKDRKAALPGLIENAEKTIADRDIAYHSDVEKALTEYRDQLGDVKKTGEKSALSETLWPEYASNGDVLLPWKNRIPVVSESYEAVAGGMKVSFDFRNGQMDPAILATLKALKSMRGDYPGQEVRLLRPPEVLSLFGGYSIARSGFANFFSAGKQGGLQDYVLFETEYPPKTGSVPKKAAVFSIASVTEQMVKLADVNQDGALTDVDADLIIHETVSGGSGVKMPDLDGDGIVSRKDALITAAIVSSGGEAVQRVQLNAFIEKTFRAQKVFLKNISEVWREVRDIEPVINRENLKAMLEGIPQEQSGFLLQMVDYFALMKTASEAIETINPGLIAERHPEFFDDQGELKPELVEMIDQAGLAALPKTALLDPIDPEIPLADLKMFVDTLKQEMGEDPSVMFAVKAQESRTAKDSVVESLHAVNDTIQTFLGVNTTNQESIKDRRGIRERHHPGARPGKAAEEKLA